MMLKLQKQNTYQRKKDELQEAVWILLLFKEFTVYEKLRYNINLLENTEFNLAKNLDVCVRKKKIKP